MQRLRLAVITVVATLAVAAAAAAAWWMTGRSRASEPTGGDGAPSGEVEIEIPRAAGPSTVAQVDTIAALDPGKPADGGTAEPDDHTQTGTERPQAVPTAK